jgi:hypothetical protein
MRYLIMLSLLCLCSCRTQITVTVGHDNKAEASQIADKELGDIANGASASIPLIP